MAMVMDRASPTARLLLKKVVADAHGHRDGKGEEGERRARHGGQGPQAVHRDHPADEEGARHRGADGVDGHEAEGGMDGAREQAGQGPREGRTQRAERAGARRGEEVHAPILLRRLG
jgi:hypothetical protein